MPLPTNTGTVLQFLGFVPLVDFVPTVADGVASFSWLSGQPQPTEQQVIDAGNDLTQINGQTFSQWYAENGGNAIATAKKAAKALQDSNNAQNRALRAVVKETVDELNLLRQWITAFKAQTALATNLANFQTRVAALNDMPDRTYAQAKTAINNLIDGE